MGESRTKPIHVLLLIESDLGEVFSFIADDTRIDRASDIEEAIQMLQHDFYDIVVSKPGDFLPAGGIHFSKEATAIFDGVSQGVGIANDAGELQWANPKLLAFPEEVRLRVCRYCRETFEWAQSEVANQADMIHARRFIFSIAANDHYELTATPVIDLHHRITQVAAVVWETTTAKSLQNKIDAIDRAGQELLSFDAEQIARLEVQDRLSLLEQRILRCTQELLHFDNFEIRILNKNDNKLELVLAFGMPNEVLDADIYASTDGNGIRGYVAARGTSYICPNTSKDPRYRPGISHAKSSLTVPLTLQDKVVGVANFESTKLAAFNEDDRQFAEIFGRYIALALNVFELLVTERRTTTGRLGSDVMAEITTPLNDIMTDVENLIEDYIGHDDLRHRLRTISGNTDRIRETIKNMTSAKAVPIGMRSATPRHDPLLVDKKVLIADDEDVIRDTVCDILSGYGCKVSVATDGEAAIDLIAQQAFDLVLSDIRMPKKNGYEVFAAAKEANSHTPVILTTGFGYDPNHTIIRARREGLAAVLFKPFKVDQLLDEIRMALSADQPPSSTA